MTKSRSSKARHRHQFQEGKELTRWPQCDIRKANLVSLLKDRRNPMSMARRTQAKASGDHLHFPGAHGNPEIAQSEASTWNVCFRFSKREQQKASSSSGRNESQNPRAQASGDRLLPTLEEDGNVRSLLSPGAELSLNLSTRVKENHKNTLGGLGLTNFPISTSNLERLRTSVHVGIIPNELETYTRGCQNSSFTRAFTMQFTKKEQHQRLKTRDWRLSWP